MKTINEIKQSIKEVFNSNKGDCDYLMKLDEEWFTTLEEMLYKDIINDSELKECLEILEESYSENIKECLEVAEAERSTQ